MESALKRRRMAGVLFIIMSFIMAFAQLSFANTKNYSEDAQAKKNLTTYVNGQMGSNEYEVEGGGSIKGNELFKGSPTEGFTLDSDKFSKLDKDAQQRAVNDIAQYSNEAVQSDKAKGVTESTVQNWWKDLQSNPGVGSKFLNVILEQTKPDFVTANKIYKPFSGPISTVLGILSILIMAFTGLVMASDIMYIAVPPFRMLVEGDNGKMKSFLVTAAALNAVKAEESAQDGGGTKQALGIYFKNRVIMLIILGICLFYLVQGQIYKLVGIILDLVSGFGI